MIPKSARPYEYDVRSFAACQRCRKRSVWLAVFVATVSLTAFPKEGMDPKARIEVIRGLLREVAVAKIPLPRGKNGVRVDAQGNLDQKHARNEIQLNGVAMQAGLPGQITHIQFKENQIVLDLNGGGKSGKKWYQHIEVGMGTETDPIGPTQQSTTVYGSSITLDYGKPLPNLTVPQIKKILAGVLDFERHSPTVLYAANVTPQVKEAIKNHNVIVGMDRDAVLSAKGTPDRRVREERNGDEQENWIYGTPPHVLFITFDGDQVVSVKQY